MNSHHLRSGRGPRPAVPEIPRAFVKNDGRRRIIMRGERHPKNAASRKVYAQWIKLFATFCAHQGSTHLPASDASVIAFLDSRGPYAMNTWRVLLKAITAAHLDLGHDDPIGRPCVVTFLRSRPELAAAARLR